MNNPGMSLKAWERFHKLLARLNVKYASEMNKLESEVSQ